MGLATILWELDGAINLASHGIPSEPEPLAIAKARMRLEQFGSLFSPEQVAFNRSERYEEFLTGPYWQEVRRQVFESRGGRCQGCGQLPGNRVPTDIHHKTYVHHGDELRHLDDLIVLCRVCHEAQHQEPGK